jgi:large subunit ribosomal protein L31
MDMNTKGPAAMKKNIHPERREVLFKDVVTGEVFLVKSTVDSAETMMWTDGKEYPVVAVEISSSSHPAYTGQQKEAPPSSRAVEFQKRYLH